MGKHRRNIGLKIMVIVAASAILFLAVSVGLSYFCLFNSSRNDTMSGRVTMAKLIAGSIADTIDAQADSVRTNASAGALRDSIEGGDAKYKGMDAEAVRRYLLDMDSKWIKSPNDHPLIQEYLGNKASLFLKSSAEQMPGFFNTLVTDRYGALAGASYRAQSFYYGDEDWFKSAFSEPAGAVSFGSAVFDEPSGRWAFPMTCAARGGAGAEAIGVYRTLVDMAFFSGPMEGFVTGKSGKAALIDNRGYMIFYPGVRPYSNKFCEYSELKKLLSDTRGYSVIDTAYMGQGKTSAAISPVTNSMFSDKSTKLYVVVLESSRTLFAPLNDLAVKMVIFSLILGFAVLILAGWIFKGAFTGPVRKLIDGIKRLGEGRLDYRVSIKTGDEMEDLAAALNEAAESLSRITISVRMLAQERSECKITQQKFEKEGSGFLSLMSRVHGLLQDMTKGMDKARQEAGRLGNEVQKRELELLEFRARDMMKNLEKDIYASNLEIGGLEFKMEPKDLRDVIKEAVFAFEPKIREKGLDLRLDIPKSALPVSIDKDKIRRALDILMEGSLTATEKGYIAILVIQTKDGIECSVSDTGISIPKESINNTFDRFGGFSRIPTQGGDWTDPGSYILRKIVERHAGRVDVESEPGKITKFTLKLPKTAAS